MSVDQWWCCACGAIDRSNGVCPVSEGEMGEDRGLGHLVTLAGISNERAMQVYERTAKTRERIRAQETKS